MTGLDGFYSRGKWASCRRCGLARHRRSVVLGPYRSKVFVAFIGIGPGKNEDVAGRAFIGQSGRLLKAAIKDACDYEDLVMPTVYKDNLVACRPTDSRGGDNRDPTGEECWACWPRLKGALEYIRPRLIVLLGDVTKKMLKKAYPDAAALYHPAYILRRGGKACPDYRIFFRHLGELFVKHGLRRKATREKLCTRVVNISDESFDVDITRRGPWGNSFRIGRDGSRADVINKFRARLLADPRMMARVRRDLMGKVLGCCCKPRACHGDVYVEVCDG